MSKPLCMAVLAASLVTSSISAQSFYIPSNTPTTGTCNVIPFGTQNTAATWVNQRVQHIIKASELGNKPVLSICDIAFAPCSPGNPPVKTNFIQHFDNIEIVMGQTSATTLSSTFSANLVTNVQTVLKAKPYDWHCTTDTWCRIGLDKNYLYIAGKTPNLVIQITVRGNHRPTGTGSGFHRDSTNQRCYAINFTGPVPATGSVSTTASKLEVVVGMNDLRGFGVGCQSASGAIPVLSFGGSAQLGSTFSIDLASAPATTPLFHVVGLTRYPSPIDLVFLNSTGCNLYETVDYLFGGVTTPTGTWGAKFAVPKDSSLLCFRLYTQLFALEKGRFVASNYGRILPGN